MSAALTELLDFTTTVRTNGVTDVAEPTVSDRPDGAEANVRLTVLGLSWRWWCSGAAGVLGGQLQLEIRRVVVVRCVERSARNALPGLHGVRMAVPGGRAVMDDQRPRQCRGCQRPVLRVGGVPRKGDRIANGVGDCRAG